VLSTNWVEGDRALNLVLTWTLKVILRALWLVYVIALSIWRVRVYFTSHCSDSFSVSPRSEDRTFHDVLRWISTLNIKEIDTFHERKCFPTESLQRSFKDLCMIVSTHPVCLNRERKYFTLQLLAVLVFRSVNRLARLLRMEQIPVYIVLFWCFSHEFDISSLIVLFNYRKREGHITLKRRKEGSISLPKSDSLNTFEHLPGLTR